MQDVCSLERQIVWQHDRMYGVTARISGMPGGKGAPTGYDAALAAIGELSEEYGKRMQEYVCALKNAEQIINPLCCREVIVPAIREMEAMEEMEE